MATLVICGKAVEKKDLADFTKQLFRNRQKDRKEKKNKKGENHGSEY